MTELGEGILERQNSPEGLRLNAAAHHYYGRGKRLRAFQLGLIAGSLVMTVLSQIGHLKSDGQVVYDPESIRGWAAMYGLSASLFNEMVLQPVMSEHQATGAKIQETFDAFVLQLPWNSVLLPKRVPPEEIDPAAVAYIAKHTDAKLIDWYPAGIGVLPLAAARLVCQRASRKWDQSARSLLSAWCLSALLILLGCCVVAAMLLRLTVEGLALRLIAPLLPVLLWLGKERVGQLAASKRSGEAFDTIDRMVKEMQKCTLSEQDATQAARTIQDVVFRIRTSNPLMYQLIHARIREAHNQTMVAATDSVVAEFLAARGRPQSGAPDVQTETA